MNLSVDITASTFSNGDIDVIVDMVSKFGGEEKARVHFSHEIIKTKDAKVREALISLGWTPPPDERSNDANQSILDAAKKILSEMGEHQPLVVILHKSWEQDFIDSNAAANYPADTQFIFK